MMTNGFGAYLGTIVSSWAINEFFILSNGSTDWKGAWSPFCCLRLIIAVLFTLLFKHKHNPEEIKEVRH